jgi:hypothetical protein
VNYVCKHCGEPILRFRFKDGEQWWHANTSAGPVRKPPHLAHIAAPTYLHCHADPGAPVAEPR